MKMLRYVMSREELNGKYSIMIERCKGNEFKEKNKGTYYYFTRYGHKPHTSFDYSNRMENIYFFFGKESTGIPPKILKVFHTRRLCGCLPLCRRVSSLFLRFCL